MVLESEGPLALPCWIWQGRTNEHGYRMMRWEGRSEGTHRLSYLAHNGPIPNWMQINHLCHIRAAFGLSTSIVDWRPTIWPTVNGLAAFRVAKNTPTSFSPKPTSSLSLPCCTRATALSQSQSNSAFLGKRSTTLPSAALGHVLLAPEGFAPRTNRKLTEAQVQEIRALLAGRPPQHCYRPAIRRHANHNPRHRHWPQVASHLAQVARTLCLREQRDRSRWAAPEGGASVWLHRLHKICLGGLRASRRADFGGGRGHRCPAQMIAAPQHNATGSTNRSELKTNSIRYCGRTW